MRFASMGDLGNACRAFLLVGTFVWGILEDGERFLVREQWSILHGFLVVNRVNVDLRGGDWNKQLSSCAGSDVMAPEVGGDHRHF